MNARNWPDLLSKLRPAAPVGGPVLVREDVAIHLTTVDQQPPLRLIRLQRVKGLRECQRGVIADQPIGSDISLTIRAAAVLSRAAQCLLGPETCSKHHYTAGPLAQPHTGVENDNRIGAASAAYAVDDAGSDPRRRAASRCQFASLRRNQKVPSRRN
jgi:hypothetical protein